MPLSPEDNVQGGDGCENERNGKDANPRDASVRRAHDKGGQAQGPPLFGLVVAAFAMDKQAMAVHAVGNAGNECQQITAFLDGERGRLGGQDRFERTDLIRERFAENADVNMVPRLERWRVVEHAVVFHAGMASQNAVG